MKRLLAFIKGLFPRFFPPPVVRWEDGVVHTDPRYAVWYAETVEWVRLTAPNAPITAPEMRVTVRLYDRFPSESSHLLGRVLSPNVVSGDTHGTLCLLRPFRDKEWLFVHECRHAITGIPDHPAWLFPKGQ